MAEQFRILVVEEEETLNQSIVNSLRRDGYMVQGVMSGAEAIRILWTEECDVVIGDQKLPGADGFELLQWLRTNRSNTRMIMLSEYGSPETRALALESGAVSYLEKPLSLHLLKEELRRLLQQTGFSASLDSFDLLDVIQIITMSRKSIALLINTGLEERGVLRFQDGELIWAEYGILRGEEAFFALAAHMNGTVIHQPWNERIQPNVTQPLSRLIFQALQYRSKYAVRQQLTGEQAVLARQPEAQSQTPAQELLSNEVDDSPFIFAEEPALFAPPEARAGMSQEQRGPEVEQVQEAEEKKEWWQETGHRPVSGAQAGNGRLSRNIPAIPGRRSLVGNANIVPSIVHKTPASQRPDLPSWLTEQSAREDAQGQPLRPAALSSSTHIPAVPPFKPSPAEWQSPVPPAARPPVRPTAPVSRIPPTPVQPTQPTPVLKVTEQLPGRQSTGTQNIVPPPAISEPRQSPAEWQMPEQARGDGGRGQSQARLHSLMTPIPPTVVPAEETVSNGRSQSGPLKTISQRPKGSSLAPGGEANGNGTRRQEERGQVATTMAGQEYGQWQAQVIKHNYPALVSALQTLGYSIPGFIAAAVVGLDGQPVAQVAVDDLDISQVCGYFSTILLGVLRSLEQVGRGAHEETVITSENRHILLRIVGNKRSAFQVLITTREAEPGESLEVMANVEGAISAALH